MNATGDHRSPLRGLSNELLNASGAALEALMSPFWIWAISRFAGSVPGWEARIEKLSGCRRKAEIDPEAHYIIGSQLHHAIAMPFHVCSRVVCPIRP